MKYSSILAVPTAVVLLTGALVGVNPRTAVAQGGFDDGGFLSAPAPDAPAPATSNDLIEPEVTIIESDNQVVYEYRVNGRLYMVKVQPVIGPPYYMLDIDGDGVLDVENQSPPELAVPQWLLFSW